MKFSRRVFCLSSLSALGVASILPKLSFARQTSSIPLSVVNAQNGKAISGLLGQKMCRKIDDILVCPMTGQKGQLDYRLVKILFGMADQLGISEIRVKSAYRSVSGEHPFSRCKTLHEEGKAIDLEVAAADLDKWAQVAIEQGASGVGIVRSANSLHIDVGDKKRYW